MIARVLQATTKIIRKFSKSFALKLKVRHYFISGDSRRVNDELLAARIIRRGRLKASDKRSMPEFCLSIRSDDVAIPCARNPFGLLIGRSMVHQSR